MSWMMIIALTLTVLLILISLVVLRPFPQNIELSYVPHKTLFSPAERSFLGVLDEAISSEYRVFGKVRTADVAKVKPGVTKSARQSAFNRIRAKHFDYIICKADDLSIVCVVELNDKPQNSKSVQNRDKFVTGVCRAINILLLSIRAKRAYVT